MIEWREPPYRERIGQMVAADEILVNYNLRLGWFGMMSFSISYCKLE